MPTYFLDLFSGIGGFALGANWAGLRFDGHYYSEVDPYAIKVYSLRFPNSIALGDIRAIRGADLPRGDWIIAGGFPCQPFSTAARGRNNATDFWPEMRRIVAELRPRFVVAENVDKKAILRARNDCRSLGMGAEGYRIPAAAMGAAHYRKRFWMVAYSYREGESHGALDEKMACISGISEMDSAEINPRAMGGDDGISHRVDRLKCLGNSIVPQIAELIFSQPAFDPWRRPDAP